MNDWIVPEWPAPENVGALSTTRRGGENPGRFSGFNLAAHVGDHADAVVRHRALLTRTIGVLPVWLNQTHGIQVVDLDDLGDLRDSAVLGIPEADGAVTGTPGRACAVMTADCLPVLFCDTRGSVVAAAHAGWRGLCAGILESTVQMMKRQGNEILAWLGPAIGPRAFDVGEEVRQAFLRRDPKAEKAFRASENAEKWYADLYVLARQRLENLGIRQIYGGGLCTREDAARFFSYRREGQTGRMASLVWLKR